MGDVEQFVESLEQWSQYLISIKLARLCYLYILYWANLSSVRFFDSPQKTVGSFLWTDGLRPLREESLQQRWNTFIKVATTAVVSEELQISKKYVINRLQQHRFRVETNRPRYWVLINI